MIDANCGDENMSRLHLVSSTPNPICDVPPSSPTGKEAIVIKNHVFADIAMKAMYVSLAIAAFVFISMLLLTRLH